MSIRVAIDHFTRYEYEKPIQLTPHVLRLRPAPHARTPVHHYQLAITPEKHFINWQQDPFGNWQARVVFPEPTREFAVRVELVAEMTVINPFDFFLEDSAQHYPFDYDEQLKRELAPYLEVREKGPLLLDWLKGVEKKDEHGLVDFLVAINQRLWGDIGYTVRMEPGIQGCEESLTKRTGSCRDSAWLLVQVLRHLGLAARFCSGYLVQLTADEKSLDGPSGPIKDFTDLHAWAEVYAPGAGWIGLDPTSGLFAGEGHIPLACTPDPVSAAAVTGSYLGEAVDSEFYFHNEVRRVREDPRVTKPYSEQQWRAIDTLGAQVDKQLMADDVRLTQGGEPTFVSIDDMDSPEWNTAALGDDKRHRALALFHRLHKRFAAGGSRHYGQGKWYPGEPLPRWAFGLFWRADGQAVWRDDRWVADPERDYGADAAKALRFGRHLARRLGLDEGQLTAAHEDHLYYLWREGQLPINVTPEDARLKDPLERARLRRLFEQGLGATAGYVLPLAWDYRKQGWRTGRWPLKRERLYLLPGDSPMGYRLPLESLPWEKKQEQHHPRDLFDPRPPLGDSVGEVARHYDRLLPEEPPRQDFHEQVVSEDGLVVRTALCIEPRDGRLHVFLPPMTDLEHYLKLVAAVEASAADAGIPVLLEGYEPPHDERLKRLLVTPDPGVIEVNIHPAHSWSEIVENTEALYHEAKLCRLGTEKFLIDGRHTGTGGGNHVTLGGATPANSPLLRRPDLLRSLITFWQHHPGLSYLFSGLFIGPTSQAPRVDEGRHEALYELEIAFSQMPEGEVPAPWLVDRLLRNLLVDVTGNTHRAEFCIDKLFSPDSASGRLGILELRAFEMPPHPRMALMQVLLLRTLIARFWHKPYSGKLVRWGTGLHDRYLLPHYVAKDIDDVVADLRRSGYAFEADWIAPFLEFRFPHYGTVQAGDIQLELRQAIEPWHVLGEEVTGQGTARFVDSSVERVQVKLTGLTDSRHILTCNGVRVPLRATGTAGEFVAGVRFRAWQPPSALHPTIPSHAPLRFDIVDTWSGEAVGGCTYHVAHPGGRNFDESPVNANAAEARRIARFWDFGYTDKGKQAQWREPAQAACNEEYPVTLDMRRAAPVQG